MALTKKSYFDRISPRLVGATFLDLFSGSGGMGLEALSRGAARATFIDSSSSSYIRKNAESLGILDLCEIRPGNVWKTLPLLQQKKASFDFIFLDPPYQSDLSPLLTIDWPSLLREGGWMTVEHSRSLPLPELPLLLLDQRTKGVSLLTTFSLSS